MINDAVKNGYPPIAPVRTNAPASLSLPADSPAAAAKAEAVAESSIAPIAQPSAKQLQEAVSKLNDYVQNIRRNLSFSIDESTGRTVVKVYDAATDELIRQMPSEETLRIAKTIQELPSNLFIQERT